MELFEQGRVIQRSCGDAFAKFRHFFGHRSNTLLIFRRKKKWTQKRAVHAVAKRQLLFAQRFVESFCEFTRARHTRFQQRVPDFGRILRACPECRSAAHVAFGSGTTAFTCAVAVALCAAAFGAPTNPPDAPIPSISSQRGHGFDGAPFSARSITRRDILSSTISK